MKLPIIKDSPIKVNLSFAEIIHKLKQKAETSSISKDELDLLEEVAKHPELSEGITEVEQLQENEDIIRRLLKDLFPEVLSNNEIKAVSVPYRKIIFNHSKRFRKILDDAGEEFEINIRDFDEHLFYVLNCCAILNLHYGAHFDFRKPLFYDIPTADGIIKHYKILYNADFFKLRPTEKAVEITESDIQHLFNNFDNLSLWKEKFPVNSWVMEGFVLINLIDVTVENAISLLKEKLLLANPSDLKPGITNIFRSIYQIPDLRVGFMVFDNDNHTFSNVSFNSKIPSLILGHDDMLAKDVFCAHSFEKVMQKQTYFSVADVEQYYGKGCDTFPAKRLFAEDIKSIILAPIVKNNKLLGVFEIASSQKNRLHSVNAQKLEIVMPYITDTLDRVLTEFEDKVRAVIQDNYTSIHPSVYWRFRNEAQKYIAKLKDEHPYELKQIVFEDVYPLYGQIDIKGSSEARNNSICLDLREQLKGLLQLLQQLKTKQQKFDFEADILQIEIFLEELHTPLKADNEQKIIYYLDNAIYTKLGEISTEQKLPEIDAYFLENNKENGLFHVHRRSFDQSIAIFNNRMAFYLDAQQEEAQAIFPHYYERFKTDGLEFNLYIGNTITENKVFNLQYLYDLRFWQLRVLCKMAIMHHRTKNMLPHPFDATILILAYYSSISISFRMDEKRFDIDGAYNARYEIVKKRIDKAFIKNTQERITQPNKLAVVYTNAQEKKEYLAYFKKLHTENLISAEVEKLDVEDLQGISGLKALRVNLLVRNEDGTC